MTTSNPGGSCILTVNFSTPGYNNGSDVGSFNVPDGSYQTAYKVVIGGPPQNTYELRVDGNLGTILLNTYSPGSINVTVTSSSNSCLNVTKYDCINGQCIQSSTYETPGIYQSLADCQAVCANGGACASGKKCVDPTTFCPDGKVCIDQGEFDSIEALISKINSEIC
ncbi:MAG: hypothetical protein V7K38_26795 [Nostoc sp.]|uniref:hypothetical protein n=1 Tax=Nostoc sp. TaxID=1180 RepID=UPI002FF66C13